MAPSNAVFWRSDAFRLAAAVVAVAALTSCRYWFHLTNPTIAALGYLTIVLLTATVSSLKVAIVISMVADLCLNYFFMPPVGTFTITDPQNWVALFTFLGVSFVASNLSTAARDRANEAIARQDELGRLFDLSRDVLLTTDSRDAMSQLAKSVSRRFHLDFVAICLPRGADWEVYEGGTQSVALDRPQLSLAFAGAEAALEFDARARTYAGHRSIVSDGRSVRLVPLRFGTKAIGLLAAEGGPVEAGTLDALAGIVAIAIERAQFLEERKAAELARQSEELKSALLASLGHDLKTPLTAIRVAATNLKPAWLGEVVPHEVKAHADRLVRLDPRLTASALAHVLENAAHYTSPDTSIDVEMSVSSDGLTTCVRDHGPGIAPADLPHLFDRFYRGTAAGKRTSGTGMGLSIARGMLAAERGRVWAENCPDGGAQFTIVVPADTKAATAVDHV